VARVLPEGTSRDAGVLLATRSVRGFVDGAVSVALAAYLQLQGWSPTRIGVLVTAMMLGSGALTLTIGTRAGHFPRALLLRLGAVLMAITGIVFGLTAAFGVLIVMGAVGTLNPTSGDVSLFLPLEQSVLTGTPTGNGLRCSPATRSQVAPPPRSGRWRWASPTTSPARRRSAGPRRCAACSWSTRSSA
jgi:MFS family permease